MPDNVAKLVDELGRAFEEFKQVNDQRIAELEKKGSVDATVNDKLETLNATITDLQEKLEKHETVLQRQTVPMDAEDERALRKEAAEFLHDLQLRNGSGAQVEDYAEFRKAFNLYLRKDQQVLTPEQFKALSVATDPDGGYLVPRAVSNRIIEIVFESSPLRQLSAVETTASSSLEFIVDDGEASAGWVGENESRSETGTPQVRKIEIPAHEMYANPKATQRLLDDAGIDVESWLARKVADKFSRTEAAAFVNGDGVNKPRGILQYPAGTAFGQIEQVNSGNASTLTMDGLIDLETALKEPYRGNATFLMNRTAVGVVRKFKDGNGQYLWQPNLQVGQPSTLLGYPVRLATDMPAVAANALAVAFGDFRQGYQIVDRAGIRTLRDPYTAKPNILFYTTRRVGGAVVNFEAIKLQKVAA